jgi:serine-type D-Ala-D-Ala endopeptidase (penicillin-binding protein 7)
MCHLVVCALMAGLGGMTVVSDAQASPSKQRVGEPTRKAAAVAKKPKKAAAKPKKVAAKDKRKTQLATQTQKARNQKKAMAQLAKPAAATAVATAGVVSFGERLGLRDVVDPLQLNSSVALVVDQDTHEILLGKNDKAVLPIASLTKLMTGLLIAEAQLPMDEPITISTHDVDRLKNSGSRLAVGARLTRAEALHLALMSSENRAAHALARTFPGGVDRFVQLMNERARALGMADTRFVDPTGLSSLNQSSARDLVVLASATYEIPMLRDLSTSPSYEVALGRKTLQYRNSNRLVANADWDIGLQKTGYIREAGRCVVMQVSVAGRQLIMVLLDAAGPAARIGDAERLRRWAESALFSSQPSRPTQVNLALNGVQ